MALPKSVHSQMPSGIVGEFSDNSPRAVRAYMVVGTEGAGEDKDPATFGAFCKIVDVALDSGSSDKTTVAQQGVEAGAKLGILVNPKEHYGIGFVGGQKTLKKNGLSASIATRGHIWVPAVVATAGGAVYVDDEGNFKATGAEGDFLVKGACWLKTITSTTVESKTVLSSELGEIEIDNPVAEAVSAS